MVTFRSFLFMIFIIAHPTLCCIFQIGAGSFASSYLRLEILELDTSCGETLDLVSIARDSSSPNWITGGWESSSSWWSWSTTIVNPWTAPLSITITTSASTTETFINILSGSLLAGTQYPSTWNLCQFTGDPTLSPNTPTTAPTRTPNTPPTSSPNIATTTTIITTMTTSGHDTNNDQNDYIVVIYISNTDSLSTLDIDYIVDKVGDADVNINDVTLETIEDGVIIVSISSENELDTQQIETTVIEGLNDKYPEIEVDIERNDGLKKKKKETMDGNDGIATIMGILGPFICVIIACSGFIWIRYRNAKNVNNKESAIHGEIGMNESALPSSIHGENGYKVKKKNIKHEEEGKNLNFERNQDKVILSDSEENGVETKGNQDEFIVSDSEEDIVATKGGIKQETQQYVMNTNLAVDEFVVE